MSNWPFEDINDDGTLVEDPEASSKQQGPPCNPEIEDCDGDGFRNTIELDYKTPNNIVGAICVFNAITPWLMWRFFGKPKYDTLASDISNFEANNRWHWGW